MTRAPGPTLTAGELTLTPPAPADLSDIAAMLAGPDVTRFLGRQASTLSDQHFRLLRNAGSWALYGYGIMTVRGPDGGLVASAGVFHSWRGIGPDADDRPEAGWIIARPYWGQGVATRVMGAVLDWFDATHGLAVVACIEAGHAASERVADKLGFAPVRAFDFPGGGAPARLYERPAAGVAASPAPVSARIAVSPSR